MYDTFLLWLYNLKLANDFVSVVVEAIVRRYHFFKTIWDADIGEELHCQRETDNPPDLFTVAVIRASGHVPKKISSICSAFFGEVATSLVESMDQGGTLKIFHRND